MSIFIGCALPNDEKGLKSLWKQCFGDDDSYIDMFFRLRFSPERTVTAKTDGKVVGMAHLLPAELSGRLLYYGYAVAVAPEYRGHGICRDMHRYIFEAANREGFTYAVRPADQALYKMYGAFGMETAFYENVMEYRFAESGGKYALRQARTEEYLAIRERCFGSIPGFVRWDRQAITYAIEENRFCGGSCIITRIDGKNCAALFRPGKDDDTLFVTEAAAEYEMLPELARALSAVSGRKNVKIRRPEGKTPAGMIYGECALSKGYLNLTLD